MKMALARVWVGGILATWAALFLILAFFFDTPLNQFDAGPSAFPILISASLLITCVWMMVQEWRKISHSENVKAKRLKANGISAITIIAYALLMPYLGYYLSTFLFIPAFLVSSNEKRLKWIIVVTVLLLAFNYLSFDKLLGVSLPKFGSAFVD